MHVACELHRFMYISIVHANRTNILHVEDVGAVLCRKFYFDCMPNAPDIYRMKFFVSKEATEYPLEIIQIKIHTQQKENSTRFIKYDMDRDNRATIVHTK